MAAGPQHRWEHLGDSQLSAHRNNCRVWVTAPKAALPPTHAGHAGRWQTALGKAGRRGRRHTEQVGAPDASQQTRSASVLLFMSHPPEKKHSLQPQILHTFSSLLQHAAHGVAALSSHRAKPPCCAPTDLFPLWMRCLQTLCCTAAPPGGGFLPPPSVWHPQHHSDTGC